MKRYLKHFIIGIVVLALFVPAGALLAQDELTLEGLAETVAKLTETVTGLSARMDTIEGVFADPWSPEVIYTDDGVCQNPLHAIESRYSSIMTGNLNQETADAYRSSYGVSIDPTDVYLQSISFGVDSSHVYLEYAKDSRKVVEKWEHCEFLGHSEWSEDE